MLNYLTLILCCHLAGDLISKALEISTPGPIIGMVLLFLFLVIKGHIPQDLEKTTDAILNHLSLLFVPAGVGVMLHFKLMKTDWLPISVALIISTILTISITALMMTWLSKETVETDNTENKNKTGGSQ